MNTTEQRHQAVFEDCNNNNKKKKPVRLFIIPCCVTVFWLLFLIDNEFQRVDLNLKGRDKERGGQVR